MADAPFNPETADLDALRKEIARYFDLQTKAYNDADEGWARYYGQEMRDLEAVHFRRCYARPRESP